ncbi:MAG: transposase [Longimicrobiales bacterium]|nr:transposase [Longimicrobiales bacterium]
MSTVLRNYRYRIYPRAAEQAALWDVLRLHREVYNAALQERRDAWRKCGVSVSYNMQSAQIKEIRAIREDVGELNFTSLQQTLRRLNKSFVAFFRRVRARQTPGFPRFKGADRFRSVSFVYGDGCSLRVEDNGRSAVYFQGIGELKVKWHRPLPEGARIKQAQIMVDGRDRWFVTFALEAPAEAFARTGGTGEIGIDVGLEKFAALSDGTLIENPRYYRVAQDRLADAQRVVARRRRGSRRWRKGKGAVALIQAKTAAQRLDFQHQVSARLVGEFGLVAVEDLNIRGLARGMLAKSVHDAGWAQFISFLKYKAESAGTRVEEVDARGTSQTCPECGATAKKDLSERIHLCPCGCVEDRDVAAARVILSRGQTAWAGPPATVAAQAAA